MRKRRSETVRKREREGERVREREERKREREREGMLKLLQIVFFKRVCLPYGHFLQLATTSSSTVSILIFLSEN